MSLLEAINLSKRFGQEVALEGLNLSVEPGEVVCLLGANGAGKTTTLSLFLGFLAPSEGEARVDGVSVASNPVQTRASLGYLPEVVELYPSLSARETLQFFGELWEGATTSPREVSELLERVGLSPEVHDRRVASFSKGMRQKLGIAVALGKRARALLLDEPLSGLDPKAANELVFLVRDLAEQGAAVLAVTHDIFRAQQMADRIGILERGRWVETVDPKQVSAREIEELYIHHLRDVA